MIKTKLIAGNWKMNGCHASAAALAQELVLSINKMQKTPDILLIPPFLYLAQVAQLIQSSSIMLGAQDCSAENNGAFTGDVSAVMLRETGCQYVVVGHSERRFYHHEVDALITKKITAAHRAGLKVILCVGEKQAHVPNDIKQALVKIQLLNGLPETARAQNTLIAYEPVWAIGSGLTPTPAQISEMHEFINAALPPRMAGAHILYGGSVNAENASEILALKAVDGALVGGASLKAASFLKIIMVANGL
jgi:triosephosphate isomerase